MIREASLRAGLHPSIVLSAYVEPFVRGRRVAILGDATIGLPDELGQRGARLLHVYDPDATRVAEAIAKSAPARPHQVSYAVLSDDLGVRDGAFDAVIVPDLAIFKDPADVMRRARRLVSGSGVAVFVAPNAAAAGRRLVGAAPEKSASLGYYQLFDLVSLQFGKVKMIGQAPFVGYTVADFAPRGEPEVSVDTSLLTSSEEPEHFIAIASDRPVHVDPYAVIELSWSDVAQSLGAPAIAPEADKAALAEAEARVALLDAELSRMKAREVELAREAEARAPAEAALSARVAELSREAEAREARLREIEARAGDNHVRAERNANQIRDLDEELRRQRDRGTKLSKLLDDEKKLRTKAEVELGMLRGSGNTRADALTAELEAARARIDELTAEQVETVRRSALPPPVTPDPKLVARVAELEAAVNAALREAADTAANRDAALDRAKKAEARLERAASLEAQIAADLRSIAEANERAAAAEHRAAETARRFAEFERASAENAKRASEAGQRLAELTKAHAAAEQLAEGQATRINDQDAKIAAQAATIAEQAATIAEQAARVEALTAEVAAERKKLAEVSDDRGALDAAAAEIAALEAALRDRGRRIAQLEADLREAERTGKELLSELSSQSGWNGAEVTSSDSASPLLEGAREDLRARLDTLAAGAAKSEADLQAAAWRIAQLERELGEARREAHEPSAVQVELSKALAAARDEVASLRRALGHAGP